MSPQGQATKYGVVYPDGVTGLKIVRAYTEAPKRKYNADGSVSYITPSPTIYELYGGGFSYSDGSRVSHREHLEAITEPNMRERALQWFDGDGKISKKATSDIPPLDLEHKDKPDPVYVISSETGDEQVGRVTEQRVEGKDVVTQEIEKKIQIGDLLIDMDRHDVSIKRNPIELTSTEFKLLVELSSKRGRVHTREQLLDKVWGYTYEGYARTVDTHIRRLREKLGPMGNYIETIRGVGYRFRENKE